MNVLFVANFDRDVGYAWGTIDAVYRRVGAAQPGRTFICYPGTASPGGGATALVFDYARTRANPLALLSFLRLLRRHRIDLLYLTDLETWSWRYPLFHLAGVRHVIVHDRTSGERGRRTGLLGAVKRVLHRIPTLGADRLIAVSDFVADRLVATGAPLDRVRRVYNGIDVARFAGGPTTAVHDLLGLPHRTRIVFASGRAQPYKGIEVLIDAAARLEAAGRDDVVVVYCGDGPGLAALKERAAARGVRRFHFLGRRDDVPRLLRSAAIAVVPSLWAEAFGLTVVEAMAAGVPVIASSVGGIPEIVATAGVLVPPGDVAALADAVTRLLDVPAEGAALARRALSRVRESFSIDLTVAGLTGVLGELSPV